MCCETIASEDTMVLCTCPSSLGSLQLSNWPLIFMYSPISTPGLWYRFCHCLVDLQKPLEIINPIVFRGIQLCLEEIRIEDSQLKPSKVKVLTADTYL